MFQVLDFCERGLEVFLGAEYADQGLHNLLKIAVQGVGIFSVFALKRYQQLTFGVFDLLTLNVDNNDVVTLAGYVLSGSLKKDAQREAKEFSLLTRCWSNGASAAT